MSKAIKCEIVYYAYSGAVIDSVICDSLRKAKELSRVKHFGEYCWAIYNFETKGLIKDGTVKQN